MCPEGVSGIRSLGSAPLHRRARSASLRACAGSRGAPGRHLRRGADRPVVGHVRWVAPTCSRPLNGRGTPRSPVARRRAARSPTHAYRRDRIGLKEGRASSRAGNGVTSSAPAISQGFMATSSVAISRGLIGGRHSRKRVRHRALPRGRPLPTRNLRLLAIPRRFALPPVSGATPRPSRPSYLRCPVPSPCPVGSASLWRSRLDCLLVCSLE